MDRFCFLNILIYYLYFSDLKWIRYEFSKLADISRISIKRYEPFCTEANLDLDTDQWGRGWVSSHVGLTGSNVWLGMTGHGRMPVITGDDDLALPEMHRWACWNQEIKAKQLVVAPPCFGCQSIAGDDSLRRCTPANTQSRPTEGSTINYGAPEMRRLTRRLMRCSAALIVDGNEHNLADSDELLWKGILKLAWCSPPLYALLLQDDPQSEALLSDHLLELEVVSDSSMVMNSGELLWVIERTERNREGLRGVRRGRLSRQSSGQFYGAQQVQARHYLASDGADASASGTSSWAQILAHHLPVDTGRLGWTYGG
jgi:hypothetical protein